MKFDKDTAKQAGKKSSRKGIKNKSTVLESELKADLSELMQRVIAKINKDFEQLDINTLVNLFGKLNPYLLPRKTDKLRPVKFNELSEEEAQEVINNIVQNLRDEQ